MDPSGATFEQIVGIVDSYLKAYGSTLNFVAAFYITYVNARWWWLFMEIPWPDTLCMLISALMKSNGPASRKIIKHAADEGNFFNYHLNALHEEVVRTRQKMYSVHQTSSSWCIIQMTSSEMSDMLKLRTVEDTINLAVKDQHSPKNALLFLLDCAGPEVVNLEMKEELSKHSAEIRESFLNGHFAVEGDKDSIAALRSMKKDGDADIATRILTLRQIKYKKFTKSKQEMGEEYVRTICQMVEANFRRYDTVADAGKTRGRLIRQLERRIQPHVKGSIRKVYQTISAIGLAKIYIEAELVLDKDKPGGSKRTQLFLFGAMGARKFGHSYVYDILKSSIGQIRTEILDGNYSPLHLGRSTDIEQLKGVAREFRKRRLDLWLEVEKEVREAKAMLENNQRKELKHL
uniref:Bestrophin homolog n=1 Tax=Ditylenchus dipsaci TaxID=166011 RepID=A0A915DYN4_9BILA